MPRGRSQAMVRCWRGSVPVFGVAVAPQGHVSYVLGASAARVAWYPTHVGGTPSTKQERSAGAKKNTYHRRAGAPTPWERCPCHTCPCGATATRAGEGPATNQPGQEHKHARSDQITDADRSGGE